MCSGRIPGARPLRVQTTSYAAVDGAVDSYKDAIDKMALDLWKLAEVSLQEVKSAELMTKELEKQGFTITNKKAGGIPTAFIAEYGSGSPKLGILLEYDALPGLGNEAVASKTSRKDGTTSGHGCGHNLIGAAAFGAALALKRVMGERKLPGLLRVNGCAAEETEGAKVYMAREGLFNDLDACLHTHPLDNAVVGHVRTTATDNLRIEFFGTTAHAGMTPWLGRSAVDAAELFAHAINLMREHVEPTARLHYVYESAGLAPNVVPDYWITSRDADRARVNKTSKWIKEIAEGAALATQTKAKADLYFGMYDLLPNTPLSQQMQKHMERIGIPKWTEEEQKFANEIQKNFGVPERGLATAVLPFPNEPKMGGSTDVGDVSYLTPTTGVTMPTVPLGISMHTWAATAVHGMSIGLRGSLFGAKALAGLGYDILTDAELRQAARGDLDKRTEGVEYVNPIPPERKQPYAMPEWLIVTDGSREMMAGS